MRSYKKMAAVAGDLLQRLYDLLNRDSTFKKFILTEFHAARDAGDFRYLSTRNFVKYWSISEGRFLFH